MTEYSSVINRFLATIEPDNGGHEMPALWLVAKRLDIREHVISMLALPRVRALVLWDSEKAIRQEI